MSIPSPQPIDAAGPTRATLLSLAQWQASTPSDGRRRASGAELAPEAGLFDGAVWPALRQRLLDQALAQPVVALRGSPFGDDGAWAGPITHDLVMAVRGGARLADEAEELDLVVRWWQCARQGGLPVNEDFGEVWRDFECLAVLLALRRLQALMTLNAPAAAALAAEVSRTALRYGPLKPLTRLLEPLGAAAPGAGYTF